MLELVLIEISVLVGKRYLCSMLRHIIAYPQNGLAQRNQSGYNVVGNNDKVADGELNEKCRITQQRVPQYLAQAGSQPRTGASYYKRVNLGLPVINRLWRRCAEAIGFRFTPISDDMAVTATRPRTIPRLFLPGIGETGPVFGGLETRTISLISACYTEAFSG